MTLSFLLGLMCLAAGMVASIEFGRRKSFAKFGAAVFLVLAGLLFLGHAASRGQI